MEVLKTSLWFVLTLICSLSPHNCAQVVFSLVQGAALCSHKVGTGKSGAGLVVTFITNNTIMCGGKVGLIMKFLKKVSLLGLISDHMHVS